MRLGHNLRPSVNRKRRQVPLMFGPFIVSESLFRNESMILREATRTVIGIVKNAGGCPLVVSEDAALGTLAASRIACGTKRIRDRDSTI